MIEMWQVALVLAIAALIIVILAFKDISYAKKITDLQMGVHEELNRRTELYKAAAVRSDMAAELFSTILLDLAHTNHSESIYWKLSTIRHVEVVMRTSGWKDVTLYKWMVDNLYRGDYDSKITWIDRVEEQVKAYYIMDKERGKNICDVLRLLARMSTGYNAVEGSHYDAEGDMMKLIDALRLSFPMYDAEESKPRRDGYRASFDDLLDALEKVSETVVAKPPQPIQVDTGNDGGELNVQEVFAGEEPAVEGDQDRVPDAVQGDEASVEGVSEGEADEGRPQDVIVVNRSRGAGTNKSVKIETEE